MARSSTVSLTQGNIRKQIFSFAFPVFVSMIFSELYNVTNSLIVGNFVSLRALSAVSACTWICNTFNYSFYGLGMGTGILVARYYGARDHEKLKRSLDTAIVFAVAGGIVLTILSELALPLMMKAAGIGGDIYNDARAYLQVYLLGCSAVLTSQMCFYILRSFGDTKHQLYYSIISSIVNILLGLLFVRVMHLDVIGTALATIISQFVSDVLALRLMFRYKEVNFDIRNIDFSWRMVWDICALGIPAGFQNMLIAISSMMVQSYINRFPNEVIAGIGVAEKIANWAQLASVSISAATMSLVAQNLGAEKYDRVKESIRESMKMSSFFTLILIGLILAFAPQLIALFNESREVAHYGVQMVRYSIFGMFFVNLSHIYNAACRAGGNVKVPMIIAITGQVICKYLFVAIGTGLTNDVHVLYLGTAVGYTVAGLLATIYFHKSNWTKQTGLR